MTKISATSVADSDANSGASREKATSPRSIASCSRFSVGSSVLSSGSTSALMAQLHPRRFQARRSELTPLRRAGRQARSRCGSPCRARCRRWPCAPLRLPAAGAKAPELSSPSTRRRPREGIDDRTVSRNSVSVPRRAMTTMSIEARSNSSARARSRQSRQIVEGKQHRLDNGRVLRADLLERAHGVLRLLRIEAVDDAGEAGPPLGVGGRLGALLQRSFPPRLRSAGRRAASPRTARPARKARRCADRAAARRQASSPRADRAWKGYRSPSPRAPAISKAMIALSGACASDCHTSGSSASPGARPRMSAICSGGRASASRFWAWPASPSRSAPAEKSVTNSSTSRSSVVAGMAPSPAAARATARKSG